MPRHIVYLLIKETDEVKESIIESSLGHVGSQIDNQRLLFEKIYSSPIEVMGILTEIQPPEVSLGITSKGEPAVNGLPATFAPGPDGRIILKTEERTYITDMITVWNFISEDKSISTTYIKNLEERVAYYRKELEWLISYVDNLPPETIQIRTKYLIRESIREMLDGTNR